MKEIELTRGKVALVDDADFSALNQFKWCYATRGYAMRRVKTAKGEPQKFLYMHHAVAGFPSPGNYIDHKDRNRLNNQRENLREATPSQSRMNSVGRGKSQFKGVYQQKGSNSWIAQILIGGKLTHIGSYKTRIDAARAYDAAAQKDNAEFRTLNNV